MDDEVRPGPQTREYIAAWRGIVVDHLVDELDQSVRLLVAAEQGDRPGTATPFSFLSHHIARALQLAASSTDGVEAAVRYLQQAAHPPGNEAAPPVAEPAHSGGATDAPRE